MDEAIKCHSNACYIATAIMVRRVLEELCSDQKAEGKHLHNRIEALKTIITLPVDLFEAMMELKILGNDAAHVVAKDYDNAGREEVEVALELAKELLKAVYQHSALVNRLRSLGKST